MKTYYNPDDLSKFSSISEDNKELWDNFNKWYGETFKANALSEREKSLMGLAVAHAIQCPYCIDAFTRGTLEKGGTSEQMAEAVHVASAVRGGASLVHSVQMKNIIKELDLED